MPAIADYEKQVYAAVLGKTIGVYLGRPFEGMWKKEIEARWGEISRYVHEDQKVPLVVADDDLTGTFTFVRALEDSGLYAQTPPEFFGKMWLDYLIEGKTVLWWGGLGLSTEHTAYLRLKHGVPSPQSGSIATNGQAVAEQIGAQIFIDGFGLVAPGNPALAAKLARLSASVSHDGEAVHAAVVVAAMVSAAFIEKEMGKIIELALAEIPADSLITRMHREIASWVKADADWKKTFARIEEKYGYDTYGGNCHVIPNHAVMVLAWLYAPDDFHQALSITNTAGWDTDCNAGNVGAVMALIVGLDRIGEKYDFQSPFADRLILPTADGSRATSDCLIEALHLARLGRTIMEWPEYPLPKQGAWHHFEMPGALHGYQSDHRTLATSGITKVENVHGHSKRGRRSMRIQFETSAGRVARLVTPALARAGSGPVVGYAIMATPKIYSGQVVTVTGQVGKIQGASRMRLFIVSVPGQEEKESLYFSSPLALEANGSFTHEIAVSLPDGKLVGDFGIQIDSDFVASGELFIDTATVTGNPAFSVKPGGSRHWSELVKFEGVILDLDFSRGLFSEDKRPMTYLGKNAGQGIMATGNTDWTDYTVEAELKIHLAARAGIMARYKGLTRHLSLQLVPGKAQLILRDYDEERVLDEKPFPWNFDEIHHFQLELSGSRVLGKIDGNLEVEGLDSTLKCGGAGLVWKDGLVGFTELKIR